MANYSAVILEVEPDPGPVNTSDWAWINSAGSWVLGKVAYVLNTGQFLRAGEAYIKYGGQWVKIM